MLLVFARESGAGSSDLQYLPSHTCGPLLTLCYALRAPITYFCPVWSPFLFPPAAVGCINMVPGQWNPQWVPATFLTYDSPMERTLTVVFEDEGEPFRHAIDLTEFPFAGGAGAAVDDA